MILFVSKMKILPFTSHNLILDFSLVIMEIVLRLQIAD